MNYSHRLCLVVCSGLLLEDTSSALCEGSSLPMKAAVYLSSAAITSAGRCLRRRRPARWCGRRPGCRLAVSTSPPARRSRRGFRGSGSRRSRACTRTGCATTIRRRGGISSRTRWGSSMGRPSTAMRGRTLGGGRTRGGNTRKQCAQSPGCVRQSVVLWRKSVLRGQSLQSVQPLDFSQPQRKPVGARTTATIPKVSCGNREGKSLRRNSSARWRSAVGRTT